MRALTLPGAEVEHPLWLALDAAMDDESPEQATQALAAISLPENCDAVDCWVLARCKAVLAARNKTLPPEQRRALVRGYVAESEACGATRGQAVLLRRLRGRVDRRIAAPRARRKAFDPLCPCDVRQIGRLLPLHGRRTRTASSCSLCAPAPLLRSICSARCYLCTLLLRQGR